MKAISNAAHILQDKAAKIFNKKDTVILASSRFRSTGGEV